MLKKNAALISAIIFVFSGCVSTKEFQRSQAQMQTCLRDKEDLNQQVDALNKQKTELAQAQEAEISHVKGAYDEVVSNLQNEISGGQIKVTELQGKLTLNMVEKILFNSGQANVKESGKKVLDSIASALKNVKDKDIRVEGYTDNVPLSPKLVDRFPTNWELSTARASNVVRYLVEKDGLDPSRLIAAGFGQYHPIVSNDTEEGRSQNRRIDIVLVPHEVSGNAAYSHAVAVSTGTLSPSPTPTTNPPPAEGGTDAIVPAEPPAAAPAP